MTIQKRFQFGRWETGGAINKVVAQGINEEAARNRPFAREMHLDKVFKVFDQVRNKWRDPNYFRRAKMLGELPAYTGFSPAMIKLGLDEIYHLFDPVPLLEKFTNELRGIPLINGYHYRRDTNTALKWQPIGTVLHILSGNVFLVGPGSMIEGIITGNISLLKMSSQETIFIPEFIESLLEAEVELDLKGFITRTIAAFEFSSGQEDVIDEFKKHVDGIVIWGGEDAVRAYRNNLPARTRAIVFGPKLSIGLVLESGIKERGAQLCSDMIAQELAIWDQNACTAPQVCFVQGRKLAEELVRILPRALQEWQEKIPAGGLDANQAAEIRKLRSIFEIAQGRGEKILVESPNALDWTIMLDTELALDPSPLHRTLKIVPFDNIEDIISKISDFRAYIQTVGVWSSVASFLELSNTLGKHGVLRVVELGQMSGGSVDDPHDGAYDLPQLLNLVVHRIASSKQRFFDGLPAKEKIAIIDSRLREVIAIARKREAYRGVLPARSIDGVEDLKFCKIMTRAELDPFFSSRIANEGVMTGGFVTRSGGTTGLPKFSYFNKYDWEQMLANAAEVFRVCGFGPTDRIANCMSAGDLYGSFISFNHVFYEIGATNFPFAGNFDSASLLSLWSDFKINSIAGVPTAILPVLRECKRLDKLFRVEKVMYAGMPMSEIDRTWLRECLGSTVISSVIGTTEANQLAYQDSSCDGLIHKLIDDYNYIEVVDDLGNPVSNGAVGNILVTTLRKSALPLIRYAIGDQGRLLIDGSGVRSIEYLGRSDDIMSIGFMNIQYRDFEAILTAMGASVVQIIGRYGKNGDEIQVNVEVVNPKKTFVEDAMNSLYHSVIGLRSSVEAGSVEVRVVICEPGKLSRNSRTGKVKGMIDERFKL